MRAPSIPRKASEFTRSRAMSASAMGTLASYVVLHNTCARRATQRHVARPRIRQRMGSVIAISGLGFRV